MVKTFVSSLSGHASHNTLEISPMTDVWIVLRHGKFVSCIYRHPTALTRSSVEVLTWCFPATKSLYEVVMSYKIPVHGGPRGTAFNMTAWTPRTKLALHSIWLHEHRKQSLVNMKTVHSMAALNTVKCGCLKTLNKDYCEDGHSVHRVAYVSTIHCAAFH
jgi:hypothetical protein